MRIYSLSERFAFGPRTVVVLALAGMCVPSLMASTVDYTSSSAFAAAAPGAVVEDYGSLTAGTLISAGQTVDGITYTAFTAGPGGTLLGGIVTNEFNSISGVSLGGNQSGGDQFFFGGDSVTLTLPTPVTAFGAFFNVNANSGSYEIETGVGDATTGSGSYDTATFVFAGITSTTPFQSVTLLSTDASLGSYNIPEVEYVPVPAVTPEPSYLPIEFGLGVVASSLRLLRRRFNR